MIVNGKLFLAFVKSKIDSERSLNNVVLHFADALSLELDSIDLSSEVWIVCHIQEDNCKFWTILFFVACWRFFNLCL